MSHRFTHKLTGFFLACILSAAALSAVSPLAMANPPATPPAAKATPAAASERGSGRFQQAKADLFEGMGLNTTQQAKIKDIRSQSRTQANALRKQLQQKRQAMTQVTYSNTGNQQQALQLNQDIATLQKQLGELRINTWYQIRAQLTPEQIASLNQRVQERRSSRNNMPRKGMGKGMGMGGGGMRPQGQPAAQ